MTDPEQDPWLIVLRPMPGDVPVSVRVRKLLKIARRELRLRAALVRNPTPDELALTDDQPQRRGPTT